MADGMLIRELDSPNNEKWQGLHNITYTILSGADFKPRVNAPSYYDSGTLSFLDLDDGKPGTGYQAVNTTISALISQSFAEISKYANITFTPVNYSYGTLGIDENYGDIVIGSSKFKDDKTFAFSVDSTGKVGGDIWLNTLYINKPTTTSAMIGSTITHEMLHSLGFKHVGAETFGDNTPPYFDAHQNRIVYTQLSYSERSQNNISVFDADPMLYDIAFLQYLYGARAANTTDTAYQFTGAQPDLKTIWDTGGTHDKLIGRNDISANLSLVPGTHSSIVPSGAVSGFTNAATGDLFNNIAIAFNTIIEDCDGGALADTIVGNHVGNVIRGLGGNDLILGSKVEYLALYPSDNWLTKYTYQDKDENKVYATDNDTLFGGGGNDILYGGAGIDLLYGDSNNDTPNADTGSDKIYAGSENDSIMGGKGSDTLHGGTTSTKAIDISDGIDIADYSKLPDTVKITVKYDDDKWTVTKADSAGAYTGTDILRSVEHIIGNRSTLYDIHKSATPLPGMVLSNVVLDAIGPYEFRYTDDGNNNDVIGPDGVYGDFGINKIGNIDLDSSYYPKISFYLGGGDDSIFITENSTVYGGSGNDVLAVYSNNASVYVEGGDILNTGFSITGKLFVNGVLITSVDDNAVGDMVDNAGNIWVVQASRVIINKNIILVSAVNELSRREDFLGVVYNDDSLDKNGFSDFVGDETIPGNYTYNGDSRNDRFTIVDSKDVRSVINAGGGDDTIWASIINNDYVDGGSGFDYLAVDGFVDVSRGIARNNENDLIKFKNIEKFSCSRIISSGDIDDFVELSGGANLYASVGRGNDYIVVSTGTQTSVKSTILTGSGHDEVTFVSASPGTINTGSGHDYIYAAFGNTSLPLSALPSTITSGSGRDDIFVQNSLVNALINGEEDADTIRALVGNNTIHGGMGDDVITAGSGNDLIVWISGSDTLDGGAGNDILNIQMRSEQIAGAQATPGGIKAWLANQGVVVTNIETIQVVARNIVMGTAGADKLSGGTGADTIWGFDGADTITGAASDTLIGGAGADVFIINGTPVTIMDDDQSAADVIRFGTGVTAVTGQIIDQNLQLTTNLGGVVTIVNQLVDDVPAVGSVVLGNGTVVNLTNVSLLRNGTAGNDRMDGVYNRNDLMLGLGGDDTIVAYEGADTIQGGIGNDWIDGGAGNDVLTGGTGADKFSMVGASLSHDRVLDFSLAQGDRVVLAYGTVYTTADLGADIKITFGANSVTLVGVSDFASSMIEFG